MSGELAIKEQTKEIMVALKNSLYPGAKDESVLMVLAYCNAAGLDPMTKPVHIVPMSVKDAQSGTYQWRDVIMPGIELYRTKASRTGAHAGTSEPEFGPTIEREFKGKDKNGKVFSAVVSFPEWCRVTVKRIVGSSEVDFTAKEFWVENYATSGKDSDIPNSMWAKRPFGQLAKCAESQALRKGFPEVGAQPTADEMAGKTIEAEWSDVPAPTMKPPTTVPVATTSIKTLAEYAAEVDAATSATELTEWYSANLPKIKKDLGAQDHKDLLGLCADKKKSLLPPEGEAPASVVCPDRGGDKIYTDFCNNDCPKREGCPSYE